jgi:hypothetical protein
MLAMTMLNPFLSLRGVKRRGNLVMFIIKKNLLSFAKLLLEHTMTIAAKKSAKAKKSLPKNIG